MLINKLHYSALYCYYLNQQATGATCRRFVFATDPTAKTASTGADKSEEEKKKQEDETQKKEEGEAETKKKAAEKEDEKKEEDKDAQGGGEVNVKTATQRIGEKARNAAAFAKSGAQALEATESEKESLHALKMGELANEFAVLSAEDERIRKPVRQYVEELVVRKKISRDKAKQILELNPRDGEFQKKFILLTKGLPDLPSSGDEYKKLRRLLNEEAVKQAKLEKDFAEKTRRMRDMTREMNEKIMKPYSQKRARESLERETGLNIKEGQKLKFLTDQKNDEYATIKKVIWQEEIDIVDENGKPVKHKFQSPQPVVVIESINPVTNEISEDKFYTHDLSQWAQRNAVVEVIESLGELKASIGQEVKRGDKLEYRKIIGSDNKGKPLYQDVAIEIRNIFENSSEIELSDRVQTSNGPKNTLTFGEFAKWWKQNEATHQIESVEKLRNELYAYNLVQNDYYKRAAVQYPPIEVKAGEVLYYDDGSDKEFVIKEVKEEQKKIVFSNGEERSFTSFLRWVKRNEVEKKTAEAEGEKAAEHETDPEKKKALREARKAEAEEEIKDRKEKSEKPPEGYVEPSTEEYAGPSTSYVRKLWRNTKIMSISDFFEMGKTIVEFIKRKWKRWQQGKVGAVGEWMFGNIPIINALGPEFHGLLKHAEDEEVQLHVKHMEHMSIEKIKHGLRYPPDRDTLKAAITTLCKKGNMRWDDEAFWRALEKWSGVHIRKSHYLEDIEKAVDGMWGQDHLREFRNSQDSAYNTVKSNFKDHAGRLENDPGGLKLQLQKLLHQFLNGEYVHPAQYEEYLDYAMQAGKMEFESKMFFLIMGIGVTNANDETLLSVDRAAALDAQYLRTIPIIEFFVSPHIQAYDESGNPIWNKEKNAPMQSRPGIGAYKHWIQKHILPDLHVSSVDQLKYKQPSKIIWAKDGIFVDFVRDVIAFEDYALVRAEKAASDPSNWDHDDMDMFVQLLDETTIDQITRHAGGARMQVSPIGQKNAMAGLNDFVRRKIINLNKNVKAGKNDEAQKNLDQLIKMLRTFIVFDAIWERRYVHADQRFRPQESFYDGKPLCDKRPIKEHVNEMRHLVKELAKRLNFTTDTNKVFRKLTAAELEDKKLTSEQKDEIDRFKVELGGKVNEYVAQKKLDAVADLLIGIQEEAGENALKGISKNPITKSAGEKAKEEAEEAAMVKQAASAASPYDE